MRNSRDHVLQNRYMHQMYDALDRDPNLVWKHPVDVPFVRPRKPWIHASAYKSSQDRNRYVAAFSPESGKFSYIFPHPRFLAWLKKQPPDVQKEEKELWCYDAWFHHLESNYKRTFRENPRFAFRSLDAMVTYYFGPHGRRYNPRRGNRKLLSWDPVFFTEYSSHMSQHIHSSDHSFPITRRGNEQDRHQIYLRHLTVKAETEGGLWNWVKLGAGYWYHLYLDTKFGIV